MWKLFEVVRWARASRRCAERRDCLRRKRTPSFYERGGGGDIPTGLAPQMAKALNVSVEEVLGVSQTTARKQEPNPQLEKQLEASADLPRAQQRILNVVQALIAHARSAS